MANVIKYLFFIAVMIQLFVLARSLLYVGLMISGLITMFIFFCVAAHFVVWVIDTIDNRGRHRA